MSRQTKRAVLRTEQAKTLALKKRNTRREKAMKVRLNRQERKEEIKVYPGNTLEKRLFQV
jgi:hypothetical protein